MSTRRPEVAGAFYPGARVSLLDELRRCVPEVKEKTTAKGVLAPHAGYIYSGLVAGEVYARINIPESVVILFPKHAPERCGFAVWASGAWETPLGTTMVDEELAARILENCPGAIDNPRPHSSEHSGEVHVPFIQFLREDARIVPVVERAFSLGQLQGFGEALARVIEEYGKEVLIVASSDMTHFESVESARARDELAIKQMLELDEEGLWQTVRENAITMCGVEPAVAMLAAVKRLGATKAELVRYTTSGDVTGDYSSVVAYAGMIFS